MRKAQRALCLMFILAVACGKSPSSSSTPNDASALQGDAAQGGQNEGGPAAGGENCPHVDKPLDAGKLGPSKLAEASGLVESRAHPGLLWLHNDSGDSARLFALATDGKSRGVLTLKDAENNDWEDIALGPGPQAGTSYLYIADTGDNERKRDKVQIYRALEPELDAEGMLEDTSVSADRITVEYEDGPHDAETLLVDPLSGDLYIVEKGLLGGGVYRVAAPGPGSSHVKATRVASVDLIFSTGGDVLPDGAGLAIRTYTGVSYWSRDPAQPLETAFDGDPCSLPLANESQGEALGFSADGKGYFTVSEGAEAMLHAYRFR